MKKGMNELNELESILMQSMKNEELKKQDLSPWTYEVIQSSEQLHNYRPKIKGHREMYYKK